MSNTASFTARSGDALARWRAMTKNWREGANACGACAMGDEAASLLGVWVLRSAYLQRVDNGEKFFQYGDAPRGVLILHEGGRMAAIITPSELSCARCSVKTLANRRANV